MGYNKITNLLGKLTKDEIPKFTTVKWVEIFDRSNNSYNPNKGIRIKTPQLRSDLCDFNEACIVVTDKITAANPGNNNNEYNRKVALKNSAPFFNCILKINDNQLTEDAQDLDVVTPMYNLLYYSKNFRKTTGRFWNYYPDKPNTGYNNNNRDRIFYSTRDSESFGYKTKLIGSLPGAADLGNGNDVETELEDIKTVVPLKKLSNFIFNLNFLMINAEIQVILKWTQDCILTGKATREDIAEGDAINRPKDLKFNIPDCKLYVLVVTLQEKYENKLYEELKTGIYMDFERTRYRSQVINQPATNNSNFLIDPTFNNVNRLFVLAFRNEEDRKSFSKYYTPNVEIKDYNVLIDLKPFYEIPIKNKQQTYKATTELIKDGDYTTGNSLSYEYFCNTYKLIAIDLSKQNSEFKNQQINFIGRRQKDATIFFITEEVITTGLKFEQNSLTIV